MSTLERLVSRVIRLTPTEGGASLMPRLGVFRKDSDSRCDANLYKPSLIIGLQGDKEMSRQDGPSLFRAGFSLLTAIDTPILSKIVGATPEKPYLSLLCEIDLREVAELISQMPPIVGEQGVVGKTQYVPISSDVIGLMERMLDLLESPEDIQVLQPLIWKELMYRLLKSEQGATLRALCGLDSGAAKVAKAVKILGEDYRKTIRVDELAQNVGMSVSSLHSHFKDITGLSPLQYQKQLRLHEARRNILQSTEVAVAAYEVGYESASQFSRDYSKLFGVSPSQDRRLEFARSA